MILGNILDNALEAAANIDPSRERIISLKVGTVSGNTVIRCANSFYGSLELKSGLPATSKDDKKRHGLGLPSVRQVVQRLGGYLTIDDSNEQFIITIMFPEHTEKTSD